MNRREFLRASAAWTGLGCVAILAADRKASLTEEEVRQVIRENPQKAFGIHVRKLHPAN
jgi:hypothetical protein